MTQSTFVSAAFVLAAALALSGPSTPAANVAPPNPVPGNDAALRAEIERLTAQVDSLRGELAAAQAKPEVPAQVAPVASPAPSPVATRESVAAGPGCAGGNCAVPRVVKQSLTTEFRGPVRRLFGRRR